MPAMSESFVDLSYRGLALAKRIKLTQVRPGTGYLELPTPMPVGTTLGIATDDGVLLEAVVAEVHEQVGGATRPPGMVVRPNLAHGAAESWWKARVALPAEVEIVDKVDKAPPPADADGKVTVTSPRMSGQVAVPELVDDGHNTAVMEAVDPSAPDKVVADVPDVPPPQDATSNLVDDGKRTVAMDAVDLAALGLAPPSEQPQPARPEDYADEPRAASSAKPEGKGKKKRKKRS